jgi:hypothetical protein
MKGPTKPIAALAAGLILGAVAVLGASPASAYNVCAGDFCVVYPDTVQTPLGLVTVTVSATNVVTVQLDPTTANTLVFGVIAPGSTVSGCPGGCGLPGYTRTSIDTAGGLVNIDTFQIPPGPPARIALPNLAIISIHPPGPCRATTSGTTVVFTPLLPPGPPS